MTDAEALADKIAEIPIGPFAILLGMNDSLHFNEIFAARNMIVAALRAQPAAFTGCQLRGPGECQNRGMCLSDACLHVGKTIRPRYMAEPREDGIKYPSFAEQNLIDRFGPKGSVE